MKYLHSRHLNVNTIQVRDDVSLTEFLLMLVGIRLMKKIRSIPLHRQQMKNGVSVHPFLHFEDFFVNNIGKVYVSKVQAQGS